MIPPVARWGLCLLCALLLAACHARHGVVAPTATLDVVTLNLWHDRGDWPRREAMIVAELQRRGPDVILLQEVLQDDGLPNQVLHLAQQLGYHAHFVSVDPPERARRYGNAILTREPAKLRGFRRLQPHGAYRIAGWVRTRACGQDANFYVVHLDFEDRSGITRARQLGDLMEFVGATRGTAPVIVGGDFNTSAGTHEMEPLRTGFIDAYAAIHADADVADHATLNAAFNPPARIDRIYAQRDAFDAMEAERILVAPDAEGHWASDHFGVFVRLHCRAAATR